MGRGTALDRRFRSVSDTHLDSTAHLMRCSEHVDEARRLVSAGIRAGIIERLFGLGINRELETAHQEALAAWQCNIAVERETAALADILRAATAPERVAAA